MSYLLKENETTTTETPKVSTKRNDKPPKTTSVRRSNKKSELITFDAKSLCVHDAVVKLHTLHNTIKTYKQNVAKRMCRDIEKIIDLLETAQ